MLARCIYPTPVHRCSHGSSSLGSSQAPGSASLEPHTHWEDLFPFLFSTSICLLMNLRPALPAQVSPLNVSLEIPTRMSHKLLQLNVSRT